MLLLEHEAKTLLDTAGIAVPAGVVCSSLDEVSAALDAVGTPAAIKAQVRHGDRARDGLIVRLDTTTDHAHTAARLLGDGLGTPHRPVLVEPWTPHDAEYYAAVSTDRRRRRPVLLLHRSGGSGLEGRMVEPASIDLPAGEEPPSWQVLEHVRQALRLTGSELLAVSATVARMIAAYHRHGWWLVEVNPLVTTDGQAIALDAKIRVDGDAQMLDATTTAPTSYADRPATEIEREALQLDLDDHRGSVHLLQLEPEEPTSSVATHCVGTGASLVLMDALATADLEAANFCDTSGSPSREKVRRTAELVLSQPDTVGYIFLSAFATQDLHTTAEGLVDALQHRDPAQRDLPLVFVLRGNRDAAARRHLEGAVKALGLPHVRILGRDASERDAVRALWELTAAREDAGR